MYILRAAVHQRVSQGLLLCIYVYIYISIYLYICGSISPAGDAADIYILYYIIYIYIYIYIYTYMYIIYRVVAGPVA
jgi:hypothetical protein